MLLENGMHPGGAGGVIHLYSRPGAGMDAGVREMGLGKVDREGTPRVRDRNPTSTCPTEAIQPLYPDTELLI